MNDDPLANIIFKYYCRALTDGLLAGIAKGANYRLIGSYVDSPLNWAVITSVGSKYNKIADLRGTTFGISRYGRCANILSAVPVLIRAE